MAKSHHTIDAEDKVAAHEAAGARGGAMVVA